MPSPDEEITLEGASVVSVEEVAEASNSPNGIPDFSSHSVAA